MAFLRTSPLALLLIAAAPACGDDSDPSGGSGGGTAASTSSTANQTNATATTSTAATSTSNSSASGSTGAGQASCGDGIGADAFGAGAWDRRFTISGFTGHDGIAPGVFDFARDIDGSMLATGRFSWFEDETAPPLMRYRNGAWEPARDTWELIPPGDGFSAIAVSPEGALALSTSDSFGPRDGEIWIDTGDGLESIGAFTGQVRSIAWYDGTLWVAGIFTMGGAGGAENLAVWNGNAWSSAPGGQIVGNAYELLVHDDTIYVAGAFDEVGGAAAANVASFDGTAWTPYDFDGALAIFALARTDAGALYAGGAYGEFGEAGGVARWTGTTWETVGGGLGQFQTRGVVADLVAHGDSVDATGCFSTAGGLAGTPGSLASPSLARWNGTAWEALSGNGGAMAPWFSPLVCGDEGPGAIWDVDNQRLAFEGGRLFAGGTFAGVDGEQSQAIAVRDENAWSPQGTTGLGFGGSIDVIAVGGPACDAVYGVGGFTHVAGQPARGKVVHFDGTRWEIFTDDLTNEAYCPTIDVDAAGEVAVGCMDFPNGNAEGVILRRAGQVMQRVPTPGLDIVSHVKFGPDGALWIAGGSAGGYLARLQGDALTIIEDGFDGNVSQISVRSANDVVVAGSFTFAGSVPAMRIARWDGTTWSPLGEGLPGQALALARDATTTYVSSYDQGDGAYLLGAFDGTTWTELASPAAGVTPVDYFSFNSIRPIQGGGLLVAGTGWMDDDSGRGVLVYANGAFTPLGGGVGAMSIGNAALTDDGVWVAGTIAQAGPADAWISTVGVARYTLAP